LLEYYYILSFSDGYLSTKKWLIIVTVKLHILDIQNERKTTIVIVSQFNCIA